MSYKFNPHKLDRLNDRSRLDDIPPEYIWNKLELPACRTIVDVGAGTGLFSRAFLKLMGDGTVYAADVSPVMIDWITRHVTPEYPQIKPLLMEDSSLPLDDAIADLAILINVYHEFDHRDSTLAEVTRVLRPGGTICIVDWKKEETGGGPSLDHRYTASEIASDLQDAGFVDPRTDESLLRHSLVWAQKP